MMISLCAHGVVLKSHVRDAKVRVPLRSSFPPSLSTVCVVYSYTVCGKQCLNMTPPPPLLSSSPFMFPFVFPLFVLFSWPQVMPVLIPSNFRPGPARTTVRIPVGERGGVAAWRASDGAVSLLFKPKGGGAQGDRGLRIGGGGGGGGEEEERGRGAGTEADQRLEDLDSLRQSLLGVEEGQENGEETGTDGRTGDR